MPVYPLLALLWAIVLVPPLVRGRVRRRAEFAEFDRVRLSFVGATEATYPDSADASVPAVRRTAAERRRRVLAVIGGALAVTLVVALIAGTRLAWGMHLLVYDVLIGYVALLARSRDRQAVRSVPLASIRHIQAHAAASPTPRLVLLEAASR